MYLDKFIKKRAPILLIINLVVVLFLFYSGLLFNIIGLVLLIGINGLIYMSFGFDETERVEYREEANTRTERVENETDEFANRIDELKGKLNEKDRKMFEEFENEVRKLPLEERTNKKTQEIMNELKKKYSS